MLVSTCARGFRHSTTASGKAARLFLFAGQGTQQRGMLTKLIPQYTNVINEAKNIVGLDFLEINNEDRGNVINKTEVAQPMIVLSQYLHAKKYEIQPTDLLIGHSVGEYTALTLAGSLQLPEALRLVKKRGQLIAKYTKEESGMLVVIAKKEDLQVISQLCEKSNAEMACHNTQSQFVYAGTRKNTLQLYQQFKKRKILSTFLPVSAAFHCSNLRAMAQQFRQELKKVRISPPRATVLRNVDGQPYVNRQDILDGLTRQLYSPVLFDKSVRRVPKQTEYVQIGHKPVVTKFVKQIHLSI